MKKLAALLALLVIFSAYGYYGLIKSAGIAWHAASQEPVYENSSKPHAYFTATQNITPVLISLFQKSADIKCAFYTLDDESIISVLKDKNAGVTIEDDNALAVFHTGRSSGIMHNKFCVLDNSTVITGSTNPTKRGLYKNDNNLLVIHSRYVAKNYLDEFGELYNNEFGGGRKVDYPIVILNGETLVKTLFCPEDRCRENLIAEIEKANTSIRFMAFSFTDRKIADKLISKEAAGVDVEGVMERSRATMKYNKYDYLTGAGVTVYKDNNPATMHHKVFIIDNKTVITGSYNPTISGNERNDENIIIIKDREIAGEYLEEFERIKEHAEGI